MYIKKVFLWAALGLTATATLTSCEDILGHWEKPTPAVPASAVEDARVLGAALEAGATVSVNYTVGGTGYVATFQKNADDTYTLLSNTAAAAGVRATTRSIPTPDYTVPVGDAASGYVLLELVGDKLVFTVKTAAGAPIFKAEMNVEGGEVTVVNTNGGGQDCTIGQVSVGDQVKAITLSAMRGEIDFKESFTRRVALLKGLDASVRQEIIDRLPITEGADRLFSILKKCGFKIAILSGGFMFVGRYLQERFGLDYVYANELEVEDGKFTGRYIGDVVDATRKAELLSLIAQVEHIDLAQVIAVGDGANDLKMLGKAGLGIAFHAKPKVKENAQQAISTVGLDGILYFLGFKDAFLKETHE